MRLLGLYAAGEQPDASDMADVSEALNAMTKQWHAEGIHVWTQTEGLLIPRAGQTQYALGPGTTDGTYLVAATTVTTAAVSSTIIPLASTENVAIGSYMAIAVPTGIGTTPVLAINPTEMTVAISPGAGLAAGAPVVFFNPASTGFRPLRILSVRRSNLLSGFDVPLTQLARLDYQALPNKRQPGTMNSWFYDAQIPVGTLSVWQAPTAPISDVLSFTFERELSDWANPSAVGDFPAEWASPLAYNLAVEIAPEYDVPAGRMQAVAAMAADKKLIVQGFDREPESIVFGVSMEPGYR